MKEKTERRFIFINLKLNNLDENDESSTTEKISIENNKTKQDSARPMTPSSVPYYVFTDLMSKKKRIRHTAYIKCLDRSHNNISLPISSLVMAIDAS